MFHFFKKASTHNSFDFLGVDMHSHLLPAVDDGCQSVEESMYFMDELHDLGFSKLITTPHIYADFYPNNSETLKESYQKILAERDVSNSLKFAAEYFLDDSLLNNDSLLTLGKNYVLIEISFVSAPLNFEQVIFDLITQNYIPILAHPERYLYLKGKNQFFQKILDMGCELQLNINSLAGYYGKASEEMSWELLDKKYVSFLGTDLHHQRHLDALKSLANKSLMKKIRSYSWKNQELLT
ncbi:MAG: histidinol phosphatase [Cytophagaceae bacterium BCCC1]|nr:MAG: histidinol phosphatase [Cytophagaceae bacterium BCCC1]